MVHYRLANEGDIPAMARLRAATWGSEKYWQVRIAGYLNGTLDPREALKPRVAYVAASSDRGRGVAPGLLRRLAAWFVARQAFRICVDVDPANLIARHLYQRHGAVVLRPHWMMWEDIHLLLDHRGANQGTV